MGLSLLEKQHMIGMRMKPRRFENVVETTRRA